MVRHILFTLRLIFLFFLLKGSLIYKGLAITPPSYDLQCWRGGSLRKSGISMVCLLTAGSVFDLSSVSSLANHLTHSEDLNASPRSRKIDSIH